MKYIELALFAAFVIAVAYAPVWAPLLKGWGYE